MQSGSLASFYEFENDGFFLGAGQGHMLRFALVTLNGASIRHVETDFMFQGHDIADLQEEARHFSMDLQALSLINPNTKTCPILLGKKDAELTKYIYNRVPVMINENDPGHGNPWGISFKRMFDMSNDSHLFRTKEQLEAQGFELQGNRFVNGSEVYLPLYESKMVNLFDHRYGDFDAAECGKRAHVLSEQGIENYRNPHYSVKPFYWIPEHNVKENLRDLKSNWMMGFRNVTDSRASARSVITASFPISGVGNSLPIIIAGSSHSRWAHLLLANLSSLVLDFCSRLKIGGLNLNFFIIKQLPILPPSSYSAYYYFVTKMIQDRCIELVYTSWDMQAFALECGYDGPPLIWDEERRFEIRCDLDALYFHLYLGTLSDWHTQGTQELLAYLPTPRHAVEYIMETFPIVKRKDLRDYGTYRTKLRILEIYDQMTHCLATNTEYRSTLNPPPGPPCDENGSFIPKEQWDANNWPMHIHNKE
jgi:hypothetical protein